MTTPTTITTRQPTPELRWVSARNADGRGPEIDSNDEYSRFVLQQKWVDEDGNVEWRDVPFG